jgi:hypothetical protein
MKNSVYTIRLEVSIRGGHLTMADGSSFPALGEGARGYLSVDPQDIEDEGLRKKLLTEKRVQMFPASTVLWGQVSIEQSVPESLIKYRQTKAARGGKKAFVSIILNDALELDFNEGTDGKLARCICRVSALQGTEFTTLNKAYFAITDTFEPARTSRGGNVFNKVYYERDGILYPLRVRREEVTASIEPEKAPGEIELNG